MKKIIIIVLVTILLILLIPISKKLEDGTVQYSAVAYKITKYHKVDKKGIQVKLFGFEIYNNTKTYNNHKDDEVYERIVKVGGRLYYDTNIDDSYHPTCGTADGYIDSYVSSNQIPEINNQSNFEFEGYYKYQRVSHNQIALFIENKWVIFESRD